MSEDEELRETFQQALEPFDDEFFEVPTLITPSEITRGGSKRAPYCPTGGYTAFYIEGENRCVVATTNEGKDHLINVRYAKHLGKVKITSFEDYYYALERWRYIKVRGHEVRRI